MTGEAQYCDDVPKPAGTLHGALVLSSVPHARILKVRAPGRIMPASLFTASHHTSATPGISPSQVSTARYRPITHQQGCVSSNHTSARAVHVGGRERGAGHAGRGGLLRRRRRAVQLHRARCARRASLRLRGMPVQVDPIKPTLKAPGTKRLKVKYDETAIKYCFEFQLALLHRVRHVRGPPDRHRGSGHPGRPVQV